ncbi:hypothetical protein ONQ60_26695, partial [Salmonella enterica subsp. enterica serovar Virginia]|nr:hypothetical protein [Salmonella enterica subsp. enterica serovar Virginia]
EILGVTRAISDPDNVDAEFAVLVRSDLKGLGLGRRLMEKLIAFSSHAEDDFDLGWKVNLDLTRQLLEACRRQPQKIRFVFSSSLA